MKHIITGKQLLEEINLSVEALLSFMRQGLTAETQSGEIATPLDKREKATSELRKTLECLQFSLPDVVAFLPDQETDGQAFEESVRLMELEKELYQVENNEPRGEYRDKKLVDLTTEIQAIKEWLNGKRHSPTTGDSIITQRFPSTGNPLETKGCKWRGTPIQKWEDVSISLVSDNQVRVKTPHDDKKLTFAEMGLAYVRNKNLNKTGSMLCIFAQEKGALESSSIKEYDHLFPNTGKQSDYKNFIDETKRLNRQLKDFFNLTDSIFIGHYKKMYKNEEGLRSKHPRFFEGLDKKTGRAREDQEESIKRKLGEKGYATRFEIKSILEESKMEGSRIKDRVQESYHDVEQEAVTAKYPMSSNEAVAQGLRIV